MSITYVSPNRDKNVSIQNHFKKSDININIYEQNFPESHVNDIELISKNKALVSYKEIGKPVLVADLGFYIDNYPNNPGYPGAFLKESGILNNIDELLEQMKDIKDRSCRFLECMTFYDGNNFYQFFCYDEGTLAYETRGNSNNKVKSNLWYVFKRRGHDKTLAEMTNEERKMDSIGSFYLVDEFIKWYKEDYSLKKKLEYKR